MPLKGNRKKKIFQGQALKGRHGRWGACPGKNTLGYPHPLAVFPAQAGGLH